MRGKWKPVVGLLAPLACLAMASPALAQAGPPAAVPTVETGPAPPMLPLGTVGVPTVAVGAVDAVCQTTPALKAALRSHPRASLGAVQEACGVYGKPLTKAQLRRLRGQTWRSHVPSACGNAGCDYIWLLNEGGGWAIAEYQSSINNGCIVEGTAFFYRYTESSDTVAAWSDSAAGNEGCSTWFGYRWLYPIAQVTGGGSWVQVNLTSGWELTNTGLTDYFIPVTTWNYITH